MSVYVIAEVDLKYGSAARFGAAMARLVPLMAMRGWELVGSYQNVTGDLNQVLDVWELPDANTVGTALESLVADEEFLSIAPELVETVERETIRIAAKTGFAP
jgi:NIPSNAP